MPRIEIHDMQPADEYFVGTCSHRTESAEIDACGKRRIAWLRENHPKGMRTKVALRNRRHAGFLFAMPIEVSPWGPRGQDLLVIPCLFVLPHSEAHGVGKALLAEAEAEARRQEMRGLVLLALDRKGWWFMPAAFFTSQGWAEAARRGLERLLWKPFDGEVEVPQFLERAYRFRPVPGKVVVDLFWTRFCLTSDVEAQRVREVAAEFGDRVVLNEYHACDPEVLREHQIPRAIYVDGHEVSWGYEAPRDGIRDAIRQALAEH